MKILYGITKSNWGGAQRYVFDMAVAARDAGHDVAVLVGGNGVLVEKLNAAGIRIIPIPYMGRDIKLVAEAKGLIDIYKVLKKENPDVFHINSSKMGGLGAVAARLAGVDKIIFTAHGWAFNEPRVWWQKLLIEELSWLMVVFAHKTICASEAVKRQMESKPFVVDKLVVIHHGIDPFKVSKTKHEHLVIGTIAELHRVKGLDVAIRAFARAFKYTDTTYEIIGEGDDRPYLENLVEELGVASQVKLLGFKENARDMLGNFDIFVLPSRSEALGYVLLEAAQASLPVIASNVGGIPEIILDNDTGMLVRSQDFQAFAAALKKLSEDEAERKRLGNNLHAYALENFTKEGMIEETLRTYSSN